MKIWINPQLAQLLKEKEDPSEFVNSVVAAYLEDAFLRKSDVAGIVVADKVLRKRSVEAQGIFDLVTNQFKGISAEHVKDDDVLFIPSSEFFNLLLDNQVVVVMKSPRTKPPQIVETDVRFVKDAEENFA